MIVEENRRMTAQDASILLIYTGGTIGMIENAETGALENFDFEQLRLQVPELQRFSFHIGSCSFDPPIDSSDMDPSTWGRLAALIRDNYERYDGFVVLHGTDTMAYTASALSFMLEGLGKPVILTGSQLPIGMLRTDGKENLLTSIEIAAEQEEGRPIVPEVCIFFENHLTRGNRTVKVNAENFNAFRSFNYPPLAEAGIHIKYERQFIRRVAGGAPLRCHTRMDTAVAVLKLFPGIREEAVAAALGIPGLRGLVLETFGAGNAPRHPWLVRRLKDAVAGGMVVVNVTQCGAGAVEMGRYETGRQLIEAGVVCGHDSTTESAITKLMFLLGQDLPSAEVRRLMGVSLAGEITVPQP